MRRIVCGTVLCQRVKVRDFKVVGAFVGDWVVFRTVNNIGLDGLEHFGRCHQRRGAVHGFNHLNGQIIGHHADFQTFDISRRVDRTHGLTKTKRTGIVPAEGFNTVGAHALGHCFADGAAHHLIHRRNGLENKGKGDDVGPCYRCPEGAKSEFTKFQNAKALRNLNDFVM